MYEIFESLLKQKGVTPYRVYKETGVSQSTLSDWKRGRSTPKSEILARIADYFGVTVDYLLGKEEQKNKPATTEGSGLNKYRLRLEELAVDLTPDEWEKTFEHIELLKAARQNKSKK